MLSASVTVDEWIIGGPFLNLARSKDGESRNNCVWDMFTHATGHLWKSEDNTGELVVSSYLSIGSRDQTQVIWLVQPELSFLCRPVSPGLFFNLLKHRRVRQTDWHIQGRLVTGKQVKRWRRDAVRALQVFPEPQEKA